MKYRERGRQLCCQPGSDLNCQNLLDSSAFTFLRAFLLEKDFILWFREFLGESRPFSSLKAFLSFNFYNCKTAVVVDVPIWLNVSSSAFALLNDSSFMSTFMYLMPKDSATIGKKSRSARRLLEAAMSCLLSSLSFYYRTSLWQVVINLLPFLPLKGVERSSWTKFSEFSAKSLINYIKKFRQFLTFNSQIRSVIKSQLLTIRNFNFRVIFVNFVCTYSLLAMLFMFNIGFNFPQTGSIFFLT